MAEKHRVTAFTFDEDRAVIEEQHANLVRFRGCADVGILLDAAPNRARKIIERLT